MEKVTIADAAQEVLGAYWDFASENTAAIAAALRSAANLTAELPICGSIRGDEYRAHMDGLHSAAAFLKKLANEIDRQQ